jgi:hypothetical protein
MDVKNISELIAGYCCNYVYNVSLFQGRRRGGYYMYEGIVSAPSREECFDMIKQHLLYVLVYYYLIDK